MPINRKQKVFPNGTLIIENVERNSDQATYTCVAKNAEGYSARGALEVQVMGKFIEFTFIHFLFRHSLKRGFFLHFYIRKCSKIKKLIQIPKQMRNKKRAFQAELKEFRSEISIFSTQKNFNF